MNTLSSIVEVARKTFPSAFEVKYVHPTLYLVCADEKFAPMSDEQRADFFKTNTGIALDSLTIPSLASVLTVLLITPEERMRNYEFLDSPTVGQHWLPLLDPVTRSQQQPADAVLPRSVHFYGYKGGQARSTVLAMLARQLADDGYRVLTVDADTEAPSLDVIFNVVANSAGQTILGLIGTEEAVQPISSYVTQSGEGRVDLLACRPAQPAFDMDFAAFAIRTALDVTALEEGIKRLRKAVDSYDFVLFDHRSGLSASVLPILRSYPGPVVICLRIDEQSRGAGALLDILLGQVRDTPGAYISFSLDPEDTREKMLGRHAKQITELLDKVGAAVARGSTDYAAFGRDLPPEDFVRYWIPWFHDRAFLSNRFPSLIEVSEANRTALLQLREVIGLSGKKPSTRVPIRTRRLRKLSPSGAGDEGIFIETQEIARLFQPNTTITYIFGRKGTGKTRLLRELHKRELGEPLIVAADASEGGLPSGDALFTDLAKSFAHAPEHLWWCILGAALESDDTLGKRFRDKLHEWEARASSRRNPIRASQIAKLAAALPSQRVFLIDGIETAFRAAQLIEFVEALFKFLLTVQSDSQFSDHVVIRLFLRTDLARRAIQNVEQQTSGRRLDLTWNTQSIFNFVLSRISQLSWFEQKFHSTIERIRAEQKRLTAGQLTSIEYEPLLLEIFPRHMRRNNLQTLTFLKTYFSDAAGDDESRAAFYPRLFDAFLNYVAHPEELPHGASPQNPIEDGHVHQALILASHEAASRKFLDEVKQELTVLLSLVKNPAENEQRVTELLGAFDGLTTPFELEDCLKMLKSRLRKVDQSSIREALHRMKEIGMFEDRPGYSGWWRAGRLFKSALRMKYVR